MKPPCKTSVPCWRKPIIISLYACGVIFFLVYFSQCLAKKLEVEDIKTIIEDSAALLTGVKKESSITLTPLKGTTHVFTLEAPKNLPLPPENVSRTFTFNDPMNKEKSLIIKNNLAVEKANGYDLYRTSYQEVAIWKNIVEENIKIFIDNAYSYKKLGLKTTFPKKEALKEFIYSINTVMGIFENIVLHEKSPWLGKLTFYYYDQDHKDLCKKIQNLISIGKKIEKSAQSKSTRHVAGIIALLDAKILEAMEKLTEKSSEPCFKTSDIENLLT